MKWMIALLLAGMLFMAGCPQEEQVVDEPEEAEEEYVAPPQEPVSSGPQIIPVGFVGPLSGEHGYEGTTALNALRLAASELSGDDYSYEIVAEDGMCTREGASAAIDSIVARYGVNVVIGATCPEEVDGIVPKLSQYDMVLISLVEGNMDTERVMNFAGTTESVGPRLSQFCMESGLRRTMVITDGSASALETKALFEQSAKKNGLSTQPAQVYGGNFASTAAVIRSNQPEVVLVFTSSPQVSADIVNALRAGGVTSEVAGDENLADSSAVTAMGANSEGVYSILPEFDESAPEAQYFMSAYFSSYGEPYSASLVGDARNALNLFARAEEFYGYAPTAGDIQQYWLNLDTWEGMGATITFENGDRVSDMRIVKVENGLAVPV